METRSVAIDYFGPDTVGALWVGDYEVEPGVREDCVAFREGYAGSWQGPEVEVSPHVSGHIYGGWCDFDYEPLSGIGCAVYEWSAGQNNHLELRLSIGGTWTSPIPIAELGNYPSHVDMDIDNGYIYIAYSAPYHREHTAVWCAVADLLNRQQP